MLRANQAVRLGLRAASRNPELSFGKALLDALGSALSMLPWLLAAVLVAAVAWRLEPLLGVAAAAVALAKMRWAVLGGALAAAAICWTLGMAFWSGALAVLAADAELQRRPPPGHFWPLAVRGFPRVAAAGALAYALLLVFGLSLGVAALSGAVTILARPTPATFALLALTVCFGIVGGILLEALARLMLVRAAAFGDRPLAAFARAAAAARGRARLRRGVRLAGGGAAGRVGCARRRRGRPDRASSRAPSASSRAGRSAAARGGRGAPGDRCAPRASRRRGEEVSRAPRRRLT